MLKFIVVIVMFVTSPASVGFAVELVGRTQQGQWIFRCENPGLVGKARVTALGQGTYLVMGPWFRGKQRGNNAADAASHACGEHREDRADGT